MAKLYGEIAAKALLTLDKSFARANGQPLDASEVYYSLQAAKDYAATAQAYIGQKIVVIENGIVTHYSVEDTAGNLKELGAKPVADGTTVAIGTDGKITLANIAEAEKTGTYNAVLVNGKLTWVKPSETTVEGLSDLISALTGRVTTAEGEIDALQAAVGVAAKDAVGEEGAEGYEPAVAATGLHKTVADEIARAKAAEKALDDAIKAIDYVDNDELTTALGSYVTSESFNTFKGENTQAIADAKSGAETTAANALAAARTEISKEIDDDVKVAKDRADAAYTLAESKVDAEAYATDKKALQDEDAAIREIAEGVRDAFNTFMTSEDIDATVNTLKEVQAEIAKMTDATELELALASKADKTALEGVEGRVKAIEDAPYVTKSQLDGVDGKFANYTNTEALTQLLAGKQDTIPAETYDAYGAAATAKSEAIADAEGKIATAKSEAIAAAATAAAGLYATQTRVNELETALDGRLDVLEAIDHTAYATNAAFNEYKTTVENTYATQTVVNGVKQTADNAAAKVETLEDKIEEITEVGGEPNVIDYIKVNGTIQQVEQDAEGKSTKTVNITVPTKVSDLTDDTGFDGRITEALNAANAAQGTANDAKGKAEQAQSEVDALETVVGGIQTTVAGHTTTIGDHGTRIGALEQADIAHATEYNTLNGIVSGHTEAIAKKADQTTVDGVVAKAGANEAAIITLNETTIPGINSEIAKKANSTDVYTKTEVNAITGTVAEGKTIVKMIEDAQSAATYDDSEVRGLIGDNADAIKAIYNKDGENAATGVLATEIARVEGLVSTETGRAQGAESALSGRLDTVEAFWKEAIRDGDEKNVIDTLKEIQEYIESDESGASAMAGSIKANENAIKDIYAVAEDGSKSGVLVTEITRVEGKADANAQSIAAINNETSGILATAKKYTDDQIAGIPAATAAALGLVKVDDVTIQANNGVISVKKITTDMIENGEQELILNGGSAI